MVRVVALLGDRYELEELIGAGGMGEVYRAHDRQLDRVVAVKRPSESFTGSSRERFRREARAAARLNHPHVVAVFDWGDDGTSAFLVMEHVEGRSLRSMLRDLGPFPPVEVARIGAQIADALGHAHGKGVVHRDVKPSNVLLTTTGIVKVTDFGIAQSAAVEGITDPGVVVGTAGYLAPEQLAGLTADARSDVYSLGVVLAELLTGSRDPEGLEPADATATGTTSTGEPDLQRVILRAREADPAARYQRASELREALRRCARALDTNVTPLAGTEAAVDPVRLDGAPRTGLIVDVPTATVGSAPRTIADPTKVMPGAAVVAPPVPARAVEVPSVVPEVAPEPTPTPEPGRLERRREARRAWRAAKQATASVGRPKRKRAERGQRERRWRAPHVAWLVAAPVAVALVAAGVLAYRALTDRPDVTVPSVVGRDVFQATAILTEAGFDVESLVAQDQKPGGTIIGQRPRDGRRISEGDTVRVTVSDIKAEMPDVIGLDETAAAAALRDVGLVLFDFVPDYRDDVEFGTITASDPLAHQYALKDGTVTLSVAADPSVVVPDVRNLDEASARAELEGRGLRVATRRTSHRSVPAGAVISVSPSVGAGATRGDTVTLTLSTGPKQVTVPDVSDERFDDAVDDLEDAGFVVSYTTTPAAGRSVGRVLAQDPAGGSTAGEGSTVTLTVGSR